MRAVIAVLVSLVAVSAAPAQCGTHRAARPAVAFQPHTFYPTVEVHREVVVEQVAVPIVVPVLVPAYQFQYVPPPCQQPMPVPPPAAAGNPADDERIRRLIREIIREELRASSGDGPPAVAGDAPAGSPGLSHLSVLTNRCAECHTGADAKGGLTMFLAPGVFNERADKAAILRRMEDGTMPPKAPSNPALRVPPGEAALVRAAFAR